MQNVILKKVSFFILFFCLSVQLLFAQNYKEQMQQADLLFEKQAYTEALQLYEQLLAQSGKASPGMLLKMAYIEEGLQNYTKSLYYLNLYYSYKPSQQVIEKMKEIAAQHNLKGYEFRDADFFMVLYERYYLYIVLILLALCSVILFSMVFRIIKHEYLPGRHIVGFLLFLIIVFLFLNIKRNESKAIVAQDNVYLMDAPSAGAKLIAIMGKGHRLEVQGKQDIWLQVKWDNHTAFVRKQNVLLIQ
jgi:tetratricopeptide (TPR) repeat protein